MNKGSLVILISFLILCVLIIFGGAFFLFEVIHTSNYCKSLGYDHYELVGDDYFNCCKETPRIIDGVYEEGKECVAGGTYPAK